MTDWDIQFQKKMRQDLRSWKPDIKILGSEVKWEKEISRIRRLDKRTPERIEVVWQWAHGDSFWQSNILSPGKLRSQFDQLEAKMNGDQAPPRKKPKDGIFPAPKLDQEELESKINSQVAFVRSELAEGAERDSIWLRLALGKPVEEYQERFGKDPLRPGDREWFQSLIADLEVHENGIQN